jgi:hypothetical protein
MARAAQGDCAASCARRVSSSSATYLRLAGFPRHRLRLSSGFVGAAALPPITTRCPLPPHSLHSIPAFIPVPWQRSHGTGTFSIVGGLAGTGASGSHTR